MPHEDRDMRRRRLCDPGGRDESDAAASQGTPWVDSDHWKLGRGKEGFQLETQRDHGPANTLISDSGLPNCEMINFCYLSPPVMAALTN